MRKEDIIQNLIVEYLKSRDYIIDEDKEIIYKLANKYYGNNIEFLMDLNYSLLNKRDEYESVENNISYKKIEENIYLSYEEDTIKFNYEEARSLIKDLIDLLTKVYPIGTLVELKKEYLKKLIQNNDVDKVLVVIVSRFIYEKDTKNYFNYGGVVYPFGFVGEAQTIQFTSALIDKVIQEGYSDEKEDAYVYLAKKDLIIDKKINSYAFASESEVDELKETVGAKEIW